MRAHAARRFARRVAVVGFWLLVLARPAAAQNYSQNAGSVVRQDSVEVRSGNERERAIQEGYWDVGTTLRFSSPTFSDPALATPHTTRLGIDGRFSIGGRLELAAGLALPPKQDEVTNAPKPFDAVLMGRYAISNLQSLYVFASGNRVIPLTAQGSDGMWGEVAVGWNGQSFIETSKTVAFTWHLGANGDRAFFTSTHPWLAEAATGLGLRGSVARRFELLAGVDLRFPLVSGGRAYWAMDTPPINPQVRADLYVQTSVHFVTGWSIGASVVRGDRGDASHPETIVPILDGGYDQLSFVLSFSYRGVRETARRTARQLAAR